MSLSNRQAAGFRMVTDPAKATPAALRIDGVLLQFFLEPAIGAVTFTPEADIELTLVASSQSGLYAERRFYLKAGRSRWPAPRTTFV